MVIDPFTTSTRLPASRLKINPLTLVANARLLADALVVPDGAASPALSDQSAKSVLVGMLLYIAVDDDSHFLTITGSRRTTRKGSRKL